MNITFNRVCTASKRVCTASALRVNCECTAMNRSDTTNAVYKRNGENGERVENYMLRRYCPPTSNNAAVICPNEQYFTVSINSSKIF